MHSITKYILQAWVVTQLMLVNLQAQSIITTIAGNGVAGYNCDNCLADTAELADPIDVFIDGAGNLFIADQINNRVRKVSSSGIITTIAGTGVAGYSGDYGPAISAQLNRPVGVTIDDSNNVYIADYANYSIRKINSMGIITTIAGNGTFGYSGDNGLATSAQISAPIGITFDINGNLYITEEFSGVIRKVNPAGIITTFAGTGTNGFGGDNGPAISAQLNEPADIAFDAEGNLYIADEANYRIRKIDTSGIITTIAGNGTAGYSGDNGPSTLAQLHIPYGIICDAAGNVYFSDTHNNVIRKISTSDTITTIAGSGFGAGGNCTGAFSGDAGPALLAELNDPCGITLDISGNLFIADICNNRVRKVTNVGNMVGVNEIKKQNLNIYPNPNTGSFSINVSSIANFQNGTITIQNTLGETVKKISFSKNISVSDLAEGCYFIQVTLQNGETYKTKFIKQ
jgi:trimeric autotransporter adhesin